MQDVKNGYISDNIYKTFKGKINVLHCSEIFYFKSPFFLELYSAIFTHEITQEAEK